MKKTEISEQLRSISMKLDMNDVKGARLELNELIAKLEILDDREDFFKK